MFRALNNIYLRIYNKNSLIYLMGIIFGACVTLSFAPFNLWPMAIVGLSGFVFLLNRQIVNQKSVFTLGFSFGLGLFFSGLYWVFYSMQTAQTGVAVSLILTFIFCTFMALLPALMAMIYQRLLSSSNTTRALSFAILWVLFEWLRGWLFTGMPWLFLGYAHTDSFLSPILTLTGTLGVSFIVAFSSAGLAAAFHAPKTAIINAIIISLLCFPAVFMSASSKVTKNTPLTVTVIQGNIAQDDKWTFQHRVPTLLMYRDLTRDHPDSDLIIWPETALPVFQKHWTDFIESVDTTAKETQQGLITGILTSEGNSRETYKEFNSLLALGESSGVYNKQHLVPFGEILPFESLLRGLISFFDIPYSTFSAGANNQNLIQFRDFKLATAICYEIAFAELTRLQAKNSQAIVTISNDAWFGTSIAPFQHLQIAQIRAIENGLPVIRATQNGISAIIDAQGKILKQTPQFEQTSATAVINMENSSTMYTKYGDTWFLLLLAGAIVLLAGLNFRAKKKR
jgi:apolipoprotein N-acyltransferase